MSNIRTESPKQERDKRKGLLIALLLHGAVIAGFIYPLLTGAADDLEPYEMLVTLDFREPKVLSSSSANADTRERNEVKQEVTERESAPRNPAPPALPTKPAPPILTAPSPIPEVIDAPEPPKPQPDVKPSPTPSTAPVVIDVPAPTRPGPVASPHDGKGSASGDGQSTGSPETGSGSTVSDVGDGNSDTGNGLNGNGILTREVIFRPALNSIIRTNGTIAINVCVNPDGNVVGAKWNEEKSTITDLDIVREALAKAQEYKFKRDVRAPRRECGVLSIIVKGIK